MSRSSMEEILFSTSANRNFQARPRHSSLSPCFPFSTL